MLHKLLKYIPSILFFILWLSLLAQGEAINVAVKKPLHSETFIQNIATAIDNPWSHNIALRVYFLKLFKDKAPYYVWRKSSPYAYAVWQQRQADGGIEIMLAVAHASNNTTSELYWARIYDKLHSNQKNSFLKHALEGHAKGEALELSGQW